MVLGVLGTPFGMAHVDASPDVCRNAGAATGAAAARIAAVPAPGPHGHCFTCHWLQSFRTTLLASGPVVLDAQDSCFVQADVRTARDRHACASVPARAPPA